MNFLELCQRTRQESGITGTGPSAVTGQLGEMGRVVDWVKSAYEDIQNLHDNWKFRRREFTFPTIAGTANYLPSAISLTELSHWYTDEQFRIYLTATGTDDEQRMQRWEWDAFKDTFLYSANRSISGRPTDYAIKDEDNSIQLWAKPDAIYTVTGDYYIRPDVMEENSDEPIFPREFHMLIVWRALLFYAPFEAAPEKFTQAQNEHKRLLANLRRRWLPTMSLGAALA